MEVRGGEPRKRIRQVEQSGADGALEETEGAGGLETMRPCRGNAGPVVHQDRVCTDGCGECNGGSLAGIELGKPRIGVGWKEGCTRSQGSSAAIHSRTGAGVRRWSSSSRTSGGISTSSTRMAMIPISPISTR